MVSCEPEVLMVAAPWATVPPVDWLAPAAGKHPGQQGVKHHGRLAGESENKVRFIRKSKLPGQGEIKDGSNALVSRCPQRQGAKKARFQCDPMAAPRRNPRPTTACFPAGLADPADRYWQNPYRPCRGGHQGLAIHRAHHVGRRLLLERHVPAVVAEDLSLLIPAHAVDAPSPKRSTLSKGSLVHCPSARTVVSQLV